MVNDFVLWLFPRAKVLWLPFYVLRMYKWTYSVRLHILQKPVHSVQLHYTLYRLATMPMDSVVLHVQDEIAARTAEVYHTGQPGFEPEHTDVRSRVRTMPTVAPLTVAAPGDAHFIYYDHLGRRSFSRDGALMVEDGMIKNRDGKSIVGYRDASRETTELHIDAHDLALGRVQGLHIESNGAICYTRTFIDPHTMQRRNERVLVGTIALARFPAGTQLIAAPGGERAPLGLEPYIGRAGDGNFAMLQPGRVDAGGIDMNRALGRIHDLYAQLEALGAANQARMGTDKTVTDLVK